MRTGEQPALRSLPGGSQDPGPRIELTETHHESEEDILALFKTGMLVVLRDVNGRGAKLNGWEARVRKPGRGAITAGHVPVTLVTNGAKTTIHWDNLDMVEDE